MSFNNVCKLLAEKYPAELVRWLTASESANVKVLKTELSIEPIRADSVTFIQTNNQILHIEFQTLTQSKQLIPHKHYYRKLPKKSLKFQIGRLGKIQLFILRF